MTPFNLYYMAQTGFLVLVAIVLSVFLSVFLEYRRSKKKALREQIYPLRRNWLDRQADRELWLERNYLRRTELNSEYQKLLQREIGALSVYGLYSKLSPDNRAYMQWLVRQMDDSVAEVPPMTKRE